MDITPTSTATATATTTAGAVKTPEAEAETPPSRIQQPPPIIKPLSFTNGVLKRLHHHHAPPAVVVTYKECLKNHAAAMGGHAVDGCGEFMPSPTATPSDPTSLKCAACGCHRNFHRRDPEEPVLPPPTPSAAQHVIEYQPHHRHHPPPPPPPPQPRGGNSTPNSPSPPPISSSYYPSAPHMLLALSSGLSGHPPESNPANNTAVISPTSSGRKRFRTRFTTEQKSKMYEFAEKIGWKFQKRDEQAISDFCGQVGVDRVVFKVWMHNNKNTLGKKEVNNTTTTNGNNGNNSLNTATTDHHNGGDESLNHHHHNHNHQQHHSDSGSGHHVVVTNGSSSSS